MGYLTAKQLSDKWGITERRILKLCNENRIDGAIKNGMVWLIPEDTMKPSDKRSKISKYIKTQKRVMIININNEIGYNLISLLKKEGYIIDGTYIKGTKINIKKLENANIFKMEYDNSVQLLKETSKYYDALIVISIEDVAKEDIIKNFARKMNSESSIVLVNSIKNSKEKLESKLAKELREDIGLRINAINIDAPILEDKLINYNEVSEDVFELLTKFKNTTGMSISTDVGYIKFDEKGRTEDLEVGRFYKAINSYLKRLNKESYMWCASIMLNDEWTEEPAEMNFRVNNIDAANRGANIERIFIFSKSRIKEFKENKTLKIYMQSNIKTMFVDYDEIKEKEPELLEIVNNGWDGIDEGTLIIDLSNEDTKRGYISSNRNEIKKAKKCFEKLKKYSKDLKQVLK